MTEKMFDLTGKVALVTGANSGLGFAFAEGMARAGSDLVIWGRRKDANDKAAEKLRAFGVKVHSAEVDVTDEAQIVAGVADALAAMGRIDTVVANAGIANPVPFIDMDADSYNALMNVNQHGVVFTLREVARHMVARAEAGDPGGSMILCGSGSIFQGVPTLVQKTARNRGGGIQ